MILVHVAAPVDRFCQRRLKNRQEKKANDSTTAPSKSSALAHWIDSERRVDRNDRVDLRLDQAAASHRHPLSELHIRLGMSTEMVD